MKAIQCPVDCKHLDQHERYQRAKISDEFHQAWMQKVVPLYQKQDRFGIDFLLFVEFSLYRFLHQRPQTTDEAVLEGLKFLHRQLSPIQVIEALGNAPGKHLVEAVTEYRRQHPQFDEEKAQEMVDILISLFVEKLSDDRQTVAGFMGHLETHFDVSSALDAGDANDVQPPPQIITPRG